MTGMPQQKRIIIKSGLRVILKKAAEGYKSDYFSHLNETYQNHVA